MCVCVYVHLSVFVLIQPVLPSMQFDSSVGVATCYRMDGPGFELQSGQEIISSPPSRPTPGAHRAFGAMGTWSIFPDAGKGGG